MEIKDNIYGKTVINDKVLLGLMVSPALLRLKNCSQFGIPDKYYHFKGFSRYEHSIGVMILLKKLGASLEEQIAGLLHDVSILAFSHIADFVFGEGNRGIEDFQDRNHESFIKNTEIPKILEKFNFSFKKIVNYGNFSLLEKKIPDLCADRVDYALREFKYWLNPAIVHSSINGIISHDNEIIFDNEEYAFIFASNFLELQNRHWGGAEAPKRYELFSNALKHALDRQIIEYKDFFKDDKFVMRKLEQGSDKTIKTILEALRKGAIDKFSSGKKVFKKFRHVDPKVLINGGLKRLSEVNPAFAAKIKAYKKINEKGVIV